VKSNNFIRNSGIFLFYSSLSETTQPIPDEWESVYRGSYSEHVVYFTENFNLASVQSFPITCRPCTHTNKFVASKSMECYQPTICSPCSYRAHTTAMMISKRKCLGVIVLFWGEGGEIGIHEKDRPTLVQMPNIIVVRYRLLHIHCATSRHNYMQYY